MNDGATLVIYRNCGFEYPLAMQDQSGNPIDITGYEFAFVIAPKQPDRSFGTPVLSIVDPVILSTSGSVTFVLRPGDTMVMQIGIAYHYRTMAMAPSSSPQVIRSGRIRLHDAPQFP